MTSLLSALFILAAGWSLTGFDLDRLRWNPRERTEAGLESLSANREQKAVEAFETAARIDSEDPVLRFNAGSAHLLAGSEGAIPHLELAAELASETLRASANYNLGNARVAGGDTAGAIAAYEQALRLEPGHEDAKFNLELALRQQQENEEKQKQQDQSGDSKGEDDQNEQGNENGQSQQNDTGSEQEPAPNEPDDPTEQNEQQGPGDEQDNDEGRGEQKQQLPRFEEQPDMSAEQAAAILEAVENLEREQRRAQAAKEMKKRSRKGKDW